MTSDDTSIYVCEPVARILQLHDYLFEPSFRALPIAEQLDQQARTLHAAFGRADLRAIPQISNWLPGAAPKTDEEIMSAPFSMPDAQLTIAREYGFANWHAVISASPTHADLQFEHAADAVTNGDIEALQTLLQQYPQLVTDRSRYGHRATLLHYIAANGVETWRQKTPSNAAKVARFLIKHGADVNAEAKIYGGGQTTLNLSLTSARPAAAGVIDELAGVLRQG